MRIGRRAARLAFERDILLGYWTDLRETACFGGFCGHSQDGYFARAS